jgi:hypothetical protein
LKIHFKLCTNNFLKCFQTVSYNNDVSLIQWSDTRFHVRFISVADKQQVDLQHRILNILNNTSGASGSAVAAIPTAVPAPIAPVPAPVAPVTGPWAVGSQGAATGAGPTPLLNDPTVQKALDSLIQGDLLRKISSTSTPATTTASSLGTPPSQPLFGAFAGGTGRRF